MCYISFLVANSNSRFYGDWSLSPSLSPSLTSHFNMRMRQLLAHSQLEVFRPCFFLTDHIFPDGLPLLIMVSAAIGGLLLTVVLVVVVLTCRRVNRKPNINLDPDTKTSPQPDR